MGAADGCLKMEVGAACGCLAEFRCVAGCKRLLMEGGAGHFRGCRWRCVCSCPPESAGGAWGSSRVAEAAGGGWRQQMADGEWRLEADV